MIRRPPRSTQSRSSAASDVYKRQGLALGAAAASRVSRERLAAQLDGTVDLEGVQPCDAVGQRRLAAARLADQGQAAMVVEVDGDVLKDLLRLVVGVDVVGAHHH